MNIIPFPISAERESARLQAIHFDRLDLEELAAELGTPDQWLSSAVSHLKVATCEPPGSSAGSVEVSTAAIHLVLMRLEQLEHGGEPWVPGQRDAA